MKIKFSIFPLFLFIIFSCGNKQETKQITIQERDSIKKEIEQREDFVSAEAIYMPDTTAKWLNKFTIKDERFKNKVQKSILHFYQRDSFKTRWLYDKEPTKLLESYFDVLKNSVEYGLNPETYSYKDLRDSTKVLYKKPHTPLDIAELDKQITASFMLFAHHLIEGRIIEPSQGDKIWNKTEASENEVKLLSKVTDTEDLKKAVETLHPNIKFYEKMRAKLVELRKAKKEIYNQFEIKNLRKFKPGYESKNIALLRENLESRGYVLQNDTLKNRVDKNLIEVIKQFQKDKNIAVDGLPGKSTLYYLNMTNENKMDLLILNMERMRWLNKDFGKEYLIVNIPQYTLFGVEEGEIKLRMKVIVGKEYHPTPIFMDQLEYIEFRPTWTVPQSIIRNEMIPRMVSNPTRYIRKGFTITEKGRRINPANIDWSDKSVYRRHFMFVQKPSKSNALGLVKFIFPNNLSIYLHDTPTDYLFEREERALSHGCVRVAEPAKLAAYLLKDQKGWDIEKVKKAMHSGRSKQRVHFDKKIMVQLLYITAFVKNDEIIILNDIYGFDKAQLKILKQY